MDIDPEGRELFFEEEFSGIADVNVLFETPKDALFIAADRGFVEIIRRLLNDGFEE